MSALQSQAHAEASAAGDELTVRLSGEWRMMADRPTWAGALGDHTGTRVRVVAGAIGAWDSSLALFVRDARAWAASHGAELEIEGLPAGAEQLAQLLARKPEAPATRAVGLPDLFSIVGKATFKLWSETKDIAQLVGECAFSVGRFVRGQAQFRWSDCIMEMQACGVMALPIVGLISFLVGVTMAYTGSIVVRQYGGDIWLADMVGLAVLREMGPMMAAIVLAGRTGAAFAATLGNMKANEEIDALETLGVSPIDFLVMPRLMALFFMMPLLALYASALGIAGGFAVAHGLLDIPAAAYWVETKSILDLSDLFTGLIKAATFGLLIGLAGCLRGLQAERSAAGVGAAATAAVVTSIFLIVVADSIYAVIFNILNW